jgi:DNA polymerase-3 subunit delta'
VNPGFAQVLAQEQAVKTLQLALAQGRVAHAYLFEGPSGVGKERTAMALATALLCRSARSGAACSCSTCERIRAGNHPDLRILRPRDEGDRNLQVEVIRAELLPFTRFAPFEAEAACVIFPEADVSFPVNHAEAANALLKTLEEPRSRVTFLLLAERPDRLLPTIRSRCQRLRFRPLPKHVLQQILSEQGVPEEAQAPVIALSQGRADRALALAAQDNVKQLLDQVLSVDAAVAARRPGELLDLAHTLADHPEVESLLGALQLFYRDVAACALQGEGSALAFPGHAELLRTRADALGPLRAAERVSAISEVLEAIELNGNPEIALDALLFGFASGRDRGLVAVPKTR